MEPLLKTLDIPFTFRPRPAPVPGDLRPTWRIALLLLILLNSRARKASLQKLHVMNWAARSKINRGLIIRYAKGELSKDEVIPRVEPSLNRAIDLARGEGLVSVESGKNLTLTQIGVKAAEEIDKDVECLQTEKFFLKEVRAFANEGNIENLLIWNAKI
jgi:hypothetical protein